MGKWTDLDGTGLAFDSSQEYMRCGVRLEWLIDPQSDRVEVYRQDREVEILNSPDRLSGEDVLLGFELNLRGILH